MHGPGNGKALRQRAKDQQVAESLRHCTAETQAAASGPERETIGGVRTPTVQGSHLPKHRSCSKAPSSNAAPYHWADPWLPGRGHWGPSALCAPGCCSNQTPLCKTQTGHFLTAAAPWPAPVPSPAWATCSPSSSARAHDMSSRAPSQVVQSILGHFGAHWGVEWRLF